MPINEEGSHNLAVRFFERFKRQPETGPVPDWARFMSYASYKKIVALIESTLTRMKVEYTMSLAGGYFRLKGDDWTYGLANLAQMCHGAPEIHWQNIITDYLFTTLTREAGPPEKFEDAKDLLKIRLMPLDMSDFTVTEYPISDQFRTVLVADMPKSVVTIHPDRPAEWRKSPQELFELALENVWKEGRPEEKEYDLGGCKVQGLGGDSFFVSTHALMLDRYMIPPPPRGALVAVPNRHIVVYHPIVNSTAVVAVGSMAAMANKLCEEGPGSVSPSLFHWYQNELRHLPMSLTKGKLIFAPPEYFVALLNDLPEA